MENLDKQIDLSVIVLAFRNQEKLKVTLDAVFKSETAFNYEVIVVDNDSKDGTAEMVEKDYSQAKLIRNPNNGFSKGNNVGIRQSTGRYVLLLNPDTAVQPNTFQKCLEKMDTDSKIGILGCKLIKEDGSLDLAARRNIPNPVNSFYRFIGLAKLFPKSRIFSSYNVGDKSADEEQEVGSVVGAFLMIRRSVMDKIGLLDEDFFMYAEDIDWCLRCKNAGYKVLYYPEVFTIHYKGQSSKKTPYRALLAFHNAMWIFYRKHYQCQYPFFVNWLVYLAIWARFAGLVTLNFFRKNKRVSK